MPRHLCLTIVVQKEVVRVVHEEDENTHVKRIVVVREEDDFDSLHLHLRTVATMVPRHQIMVVHPLRQGRTTTDPRLQALALAQTTAATTDRRSYYILTIFWRSRD